MFVAQPEQANQRPSPGLSLNLSSNNPFRNRAASPVSSSPHPSPAIEPPRPVSRNPFLDGTSSSFSQHTPLTSPYNMLSTNGSTSPRPALTGAAAEIFGSLTLEDKPLAHSTRMPPPLRPAPENRGPPPHLSTSSRGENVPPRGPPGHHPSRSQEEVMRARRREQTSSGSRTGPTGELDIFADPSDTSPRKTSERRVRRNSESSVTSRHSRLIESEDEKKRQERRRRERRHRDRREKKPNGKLDIIDKLDVSSIYGSGLFHHDGPFDACNPHRNRQGSRRAPMHAFAKDSLNNALGGGGPLNKKPNHATFLGNNDEEAFKDYSKGGVNYSDYEPYGNGPRPAVHRAESNVVSATSRVEPIHGEETLGLGTSTFLEGAPASRTAMQRRESEQTAAVEGGLSRKKSLAQKIRGINNNRRDYGPSGRITSPEGVYNVTSPGTTLLSPGGTKVTEPNPFFNDYTKTDENKKEGLTIVEPEKTGRARAPSSPRRGFGDRLERRVTSDGSSGTEQQPPLSKSGGGFLSRVKSLKGGPRKPRVDKAMPQPALS